MKVAPQKEHIFHPSLPLAVYREISAHLRQVQGVKTGLLERHSSSFDYNTRQVKGLWIEYPKNLDSFYQERLEEILAYYAGLYGSWNRQSIYDNEQ